MIEATLILVWVALFLWGAVGLLKPAWAKLPSRWAALAIGSFSIVILMATAEVAAPSGQPDVSGSTIAVFFLWLFCSSLVVALRIAFRAQIFSHTENPMVRNSGFIERYAMAWGNYAAIRRTKVCQDLAIAKDGWNANREKVPRKFKRQSALSYIDYGRGAVNDRLEEVFRRYRLGEISLDDYRDLVEREADALRDRMEDARASKRGLPRSSDLRDFYDDEIEDVRDSLGETRWRLDWIRDQENESPRHREEEWEFVPEGNWARFDYIDANGSASSREIVNWEDHGYKIVGYDRHKKAERTFRKERISNWVADQPLK